MAESEGSVAEFLEILNDREKEREHGFFVAVRGEQNLARLEEACVDDQQWNRCFTVRYRVRAAPSTMLLSTVLHALSEDLDRSGDQPRYGRLRSAEQAHGGRALGQFAERLSADLRRLLADLSENPDTTWADFLGALADGRKPAAAGKTKASVVTEDGPLLPVGRRLVLFLEFEADSWDSPSAEEWLGRGHEGLLGGFRLRDLPRRMGVVVSGLPDAALDRRITDQRHVRILELDERAADESTRFKIGSALNDAPVTSDELERRRYAEALAELLLHDDTQAPLTLGIHGRWGAGKSSFMEQIREELQRRGRSPNRLVEKLEAPATYKSCVPIASVWFNAWRYEDAEQIWAGLLTRVTESIESQAGAGWKWPTVARLALRNNKQQLFWMLMIASVLSLASFALIGWYDGREIPAAFAGPWFDAVRDYRTLGSGVVGLLFLLWRLLSIARPASERFAELARLPSGADAMGYQHSVIDDVRLLSRSLESYDPGTKVFVFIDDLDRCSEDRIMEILQAIMLVLAGTQCFVVLGIDTRMIFRAVEKHYTSKDDQPPPPGFARDYLKKIIQLSFRLPSLGDGARKTLLHSLFSDTARHGVVAAKSEPPPEDPEDGSEEQPETNGGDESPGIVDRDRQLILPLEDEPPPGPPLFVEDTPQELAAFETYRACLEDNPREIKRVVNVHRLMKFLLESSNMVGPEGWPEARQRQMVRWVIFCTGWPALVPRDLDTLGECDDVPSAAIERAPSGDARARLTALQPHDDFPDDAIGSEQIDETFRFVARNVRLVEEDFAADGKGQLDDGEDQGDDGEGESAEAGDT